MSPTTPAYLPSGVRMPSIEVSAKPRPRFCELNKHVMRASPRDFAKDGVDRAFDQDAELEESSARPSEPRPSRAGFCSLSPDCDPTRVFLTSSGPAAQDALYWSVHRS